MSLNLFIIGPSGSGKSTQAKLIAQKYNLTHFSMGSLLRDEISKASHIGLDAKVYIDKGIPVPADIVLPLLSDNLNKINNQNFIVDGFPRLINQGHYISQYLNNKKSPPTLLIHLVVDFLEIIKRRQQNPDFQKEDKQRTDNTPQAIANRQKLLYQANIDPILDYFKLQNKLFEVDGNRPIQPIFVDICQKIDQLLINKKNN